MAAVNAGHFKPDELAFVANLSERLTKSWPFRAAFVACLLAATFAILGTLVIGDKSFDFSKYVDDRRQEMRKYTDDFTSDANAKRLYIDDKQNNFQAHLDSLQSDIAKKVTTDLTAEVREKTGALTIQLDADAQRESQVNSALSTLSARIEALSNEIEDPKVGLAARSLALSKSIRDAELSPQKPKEGAVATDVIVKEAAAAARNAASASVAVTVFQNAAARDAKAAEEAKSSSEKDAAEIKSILASVKEPQKPAAPIDSSFTVKLKEISEKIAQIEATINAERINRQVNLSFLKRDECLRVQRALFDSGVLLAEPSTSKGKSLASPVDGSCGARTNAAALAWQIREKRLIYQARSADEIIAIMVAPQH